MDDVLITGSPLSLDEELNAVCRSVATEILASTDFIDQQIVDRTLAEFTRKAVQDSVQNGFRRGKSGLHCYFCGEVACGITRCDCGFNESFGCGISGRYICDQCKAAHMRIARHLRAMFDAPKIMRCNCRKFLFERELYRAARSLEGGEDYEPGVSRGLTFHLAQACAEDQSPAEFRQAILSAFRRSRFLDWKQLDRALQREKDATLLRSLTRAIRKSL